MWRTYTPIKPAKPMRLPLPPHHVSNFLASMVMQSLHARLLHTTATRLFDKTPCGGFQAAAAKCGNAKSWSTKDKKDKVTPALYPNATRTLPEAPGFIRSAPYLETYFVQLPADADMIHQTALEQSWLKSYHKQP
jgi:hypothetical protein